jgi:hypothetical protein
MKSHKQTRKIEPAEVISGVFTARRDLLVGAKAVVAGSGFTVEESDLLVSLYGVREFNWDDLAHDQDNYVAFKELEKFLVHNPSLLSRRIRKLAEVKPPLVEVASVDPRSGLHFNSQRVRITDEGVKRIAPVWERFCRMSANLVEGIPQRRLEAHHEVNELISERIRQRREAATDFSLW